MSQVHQLPATYLSIPHKAAGNQFSAKHSCNQSDDMLQKTSIVPGRGCIKAASPQLLLDGTRSYSLQMLSVEMTAASPEKCQACCCEVLIKLHSGHVKTYSSIDHTEWTGSRRADLKLTTGTSLLSYVTQCHIRPTKIFLAVFVTMLKQLAWLQALLINASFLKSAEWPAQSAWSAAT